MQLREALTYEPVELTFGTSGLRGLVTDMTDLECYINAAGFIEFLRAEDKLNKGDAIYLAGDLRQSTPHIMDVMTTAIQDAGFKVVNCGLIPTPAVAFFALQHDAPCIMVTGSHIPSDRNGIKFYKRAGEVLKSDETAIHAFVASSRRKAYEQDASDSSFSAEGSHKHLTPAPVPSNDAKNAFIKRYADVFSSDSLAGRQIVVYQHSAVGRDMIVTILEMLGAQVVPIERSEIFVPIDTENVTEIEQKLFQSFSKQYPDAFAIVSTDGDSDRPFVIDETGTFHRGDVLGCVVATFLGANFAAVPISANDAVDRYCKERNVELVHTKIGSPFVIEAMQAASRNAKLVTVGWEVNGGFLTGGDIRIGTKKLDALPTRDAVLPILCALTAAVKEGARLSEVFAKLPKRYTGSGLIDVSDSQVRAFKELATEQATMHQIAQELFGSSELGDIDKVDITDGLRLMFRTGVVLHLRPSGNAPQFRVYSNASTQRLADKLVLEATVQNGYIYQLLETVTSATRVQ